MEEIEWMNGWIGTTKQEKSLILPPAREMSSSEKDTMTPKKPTVIITIGMAGSGKTTFMQVIFLYFYCGVLILFIHFLSFIET